MDQFLSQWSTRSGCTLSSTSEAAPQTDERGSIRRSAQAPAGRGWVGSISCQPSTGVGHAQRRGAYPRSRHADPFAALRTACVDRVNLNVEVPRLQASGGVETDLRDLTLPSRTPTGQPAPGFRLGEPRVTALLQGLCLFALTPAGITNRQPRPLVAQLLGLPDDQYTARQMGYDLRRLARKGLQERQPGRLSYTLTPWGRRVALFLTKLHVRVLRPGSIPASRRTRPQRSASRCSRSTARCACSLVRPAWPPSITLSLHACADSGP